MSEDAKLFRLLTPPSDLFQFKNESKLRGARILPAIRVQLCAIQSVVTPKSHLPTMPTVHAEKESKSSEGICVLDNSISDINFE